MPRAMARLEDATWADRPADALRAIVRRLPLGAARDLLHGRWLGHPLHPVLVELPIGAWLSAAVLDLAPGQERAARLLVAVGLAGVGPAALSGWVDWAELSRPQRRVGLVHAAANVTGVTLYAASLTARCRGRHWRGRGWGFCALAAVGAGGVLGGHLAYRQTTGVTAEQVVALTSAGLRLVAELADLP